MALSEVSFGNRQLYVVVLRLFHSQTSLVFFFTVKLIFLPLREKERV